MRHCHCKACKSPLHADDANADSALSGTDCSHCESLILASLRARIAFFSESDSVPRTPPPFSTSPGPVRKKQWGRGFEQPVTSEFMPAQCPHASSSPQKEPSPVAASDMISFGVSENELDDNLSLAASDTEELSGSVIDPAFLPSSASRNARLRADEELIRVMTKAVNKLGLEWSPPEEPSRTAGWMSGFSRGTIKLSTNAHPPSFPKSTTSSQNRGAPPTRLKSTLQLQLLSHPLTALKIKNTNTCLL